MVLPLRKTPRRTYLPAKFREIAAVDDTLKDAFRRLVSGKKDWPLYLYGPPGTGKSCAALALCDYLHEWQHVYTTVGDLVEAYMATFGTREKFDWRTYGPYRDDFPGGSESPSMKHGSLLVVLDEIGMRGDVKDTHYDCLKKVLDMRESLPLILISNKSIAEIANIYDARIASRCEAGTVVKLAGRDRRVNP